MAIIAKSNTTITNNKPVTFVFMAAVVLWYNNQAGALFLPGRFIAPMANAGLKLFELNGIELWKRSF
jgi:hypothetical protein